MFKFNTIEEAIDDIKKGKMIVVVDDEDRENEGDLVVAGEFATPENINFMATHARGLICMPCEKSILEKLEIDKMVTNNTDSHQTAFTVSIDHIDTSTGISAYDRSLTIMKILDEKSKVSDFKRPGHIFPLEAKEGGCITRNGHTEASVDLAKLAGLKPVSVICEIMNDDGTMARVDDLKIYCKNHNLKMITIKDLVEYKKKSENSIDSVVKIKMPTKYGEFNLVGFEKNITKEHHVALIKGDIDTQEPVLVRIHSECLTGDILGSNRCDCGEQYAYAMKEIEKEKRGVLLYMRQEGRGIGLINKLKAYKLQDEGYDTVEANLALGFEEDERDYYESAKMLEQLNIKNIRLMTNNPRKINGLEKYGINVAEIVPVHIKPNKDNENYLKTKKEKLNHLL